MPYASFVAYVAPNTVAAVGTAFISAMQITRSMSEPFSLTACTIGALRHHAVLGLLLERRGLVDLAPDDVAGEDDDGAEQERDPPAPGLEGVLGEHDADSGRNTAAAMIWPACTPCSVKLRVVAAPAERRVFEDHRAGAGDLPADREALDQPQDHQQAGARRPTCW